MIWITIKSWVYPILKWLVTKAYANDFNVKLLKEKYIANRDSNRKLLLKHTVKQASLAIEKFEAMQKEVEQQVGFAGTVSDEEDEELVGGTGNYYGQELPKIIRSNKVFSRLEFNISNVLCFGYGNLNNFTMNTGNIIGTKDRKTLAYNFTKTRGYSKSFGGYFSRGYEEVEKIAKKIGFKFQGFKLSVRSKHLFTVLKKGYRVTMPIRISKEMQKGLYDNGILEVNEMVGKTVFGHLMNVGYDEKGVTLWIDNYPDRKKWIFEIEELEVLIKSGKFMNIARFFAPLKDMEEEIIPVEVEEVTPVATIVKSKDNLVIRESARLAMEEGFWNGEDAKKSVTREDAATMMYRVYKKSLK